MPFVDETAKAVYAWFNNSQLRELALAARVPSERVAQMKSHDQAISVFDSITDKARLALLAHRVETLTPFKHCVVLESFPSFDFATIVRDCRAKFAALFDSFSPLDSTVRDLHPEIIIEDKESKRLFIKFAHMVEVYEFKKTNDGLLRTPVWRRHVVVIRLDTSSQIVSIHFPGFSQPVNTKDERVTYSKYAAQAVAFLREELSLELSGFQAKPVTDALLEDPHTEIVDLKRTLRFQRGGKMDLDSESDQDAASSLAQGLVASGIKISAEAIRQAFRASEAQSIVLLWKRTGLITRLSLRESFPELLFIWNEADPSLSLIADILTTFASARSLVGSRTKEAVHHLLNLHAGEVIRPTWLEQQFALTGAHALRLLLDECAAQRFTTVFRIRPDKVAVPGRWVDTLSDLPRSAVDLEGEFVSASDPENIEVGFRRRMVQ